MTVLEIAYRKCMTHQFLRCTLGSRRFTFGFGCGAFCHLGSCLFWCCPCGRLLVSPWGLAVVVILLFTLNGAHVVGVIIHVHGVN